MRTFYCPAGRIEVRVSGRFDGMPAVRLEAPKASDLTPDLARAVALSLIEHAAAAEHRSQRRGTK